MPLFVCTTCTCVENTATSDYWIQEMDAHQASEVFTPKCSECLTGTWHGKFPKQLLSETKYFRDGKFLSHPDWTPAAKLLGAEDSPNGQG